MDSNLLRSKNFVVEFEQPSYVQLYIRRQRYQEDLEENRAAKRQRYQEDLEENRSAKRQKYEDNSAAIKASERSRYWNDPDAVRLAKRMPYQADPSRLKASWRRIAGVLELVSFPVSPRKHYVITTTT
eukprot:Em0015g1056a